MTTDGFFSINGRTVIAFFSRWGQLSRRYIWPHLLLGIVAAGLGLPFTTGVAANSTNDFSLANNLSVTPDARIYQFIRLREMVARPAFVHDYWHQHAIRTVIRHLTFSLPARENYVESAGSSLTVKGVAVLHSLFALLISTIALRIGRNRAKIAQRPSPSLFSTAHWLATVRGIRAGPFTI